MNGLGGRSSISAFRSDNFVFRPPAGLAFCQQGFPQQLVHVGKVLRTVRGIPFPCNKKYDESCNGEGVYYRLIIMFLVPGAKPTFEKQYSI